MDAITINESSRLIELERKIERGLTTFVEVGEALLEIRDSRLYRSEFGTFEDYCREKWGITRMHASNLIRASAAAKNVNQGLQSETPAPETERQVRPLAKLEPAQQPAAWQRAVEKAGGEQPTAKQVQAAADEIAIPATKATPTQKPKAIVSVGMDIAKNAMLMLETIGRNDGQRREAFQAVIDFCQKQLGKQRAAT